MFTEFVRLQVILRQNTHDRMIATLPEKSNKL